MYELEATAFRNFGITKFFFPSETLFNRSEPFSFSQPRTKLISSHLNSPSSLAPFWIQHTCLKEKFKFPTPKQIPHLPLEKKVKFPPSSNTKQANSPGMPGGGGGCQGFDLIRALLPCNHIQWRSWLKKSVPPKAGPSHRRCDIPRGVRGHAPPRKFEI